MPHKTNQNCRRWSGLGTQTLCMAISLAILPIAGWAQTHHPLIARMDAYLRPFVQSDNLSGVILISCRGTVLYEKAFGLADPTFQVRNTPETRFHIA